jgi:sulfur-oxidizing protein SoxY
MTSRAAAGSPSPARLDPGRRAFARSVSWLTLAGIFPSQAPRAAVLPPPGAVDALIAALAADTDEGAVGPSDSVQLTLPTLIEDGAVVPVKVQTALAPVRDIYVLAEMNPSPIAAQFRIGPGMAPRIAVRIKLAGSGRVFGVVRTAERLHWTAAVAEVTAGGCS